MLIQATFMDGPWGGRADFLLRVETPSKLGEWSYEVLFQAQCKTPRQIELANAFCRYLEMAQVL